MANVKRFGNLMFRTFDVIKDFAGTFESLSAAVVYQADLRHDLMFTPTQTHIVIVIAS